MSKEYKDIINGLSEEEAKSLLINIAKNNPSIQNQIVLLSGSKIGPKQIEAIKSDIAEIMNAITGGSFRFDRNYKGLINSYRREMTQILLNQIDPLIQVGNLSTASELLKTIYYDAQESFDCDFVMFDEGFDFIYNSLFERWKAIYTKASPEMRKKIIASLEDGVEEDEFYIEDDHGLLSLINEFDDLDL